MDEHTLECLDFFRVREMLAGCALTELGRKLAGTIQPVANEKLVRRWFAQLREFQAFAEERGLPPLGGLTDVRETVQRCAPPLKVDVDDMARIGDALAATHAVATWLAALPADSGELRHLAQRVGDFETIATRIRAVIDERGQVRDDASPKLAGIRAEIRRAGQQIRATVDRLLHEPETRKLLQFPNYTFHNDRLVLPVRAEYRGRMPGIVHRSSDSGATIYVEPSLAVELNNRISNLRAEEAEEIARLLWELAHEVYINAEPIIKTLDALAVLDLLVAKHRLAQQYEMRCPEPCSEPRLAVRNARHPLLLELARRRAADEAEPLAVVPISYRLGDDFAMLVITGPNTGGKTVTLKTIGLLTLMAQAGLPVPVDEGSTFGLFKHVMIDIGDEQNMQQSLSTFSAHLQRQMEMLHKADARSLLLIDELGAGTDPDEGAALGRAILDEILRLGARCVVTTHIGALKGFPLTREQAENACVEFDTETLRPTYHLRIGEAGQSNAIAIATRLGMPRRLVQAAKKSLSRKTRALHAALEGAAGARRKAEEARAQAETAQLEAGRARHQAEHARAALEKKQADFEQWARRVAHLQPGEPVRVRGFDRDGRVVRMRIDHHRAEVDVGAFTVEVPLGDILPPETPLPPEPPPPRARPATSAPRKKRRRAPEKPPAAGGRCAKSPRRSGPKPRRQYAPLSAEEILALQAGDRVIVKRLHRDGRVVRVEPGKKQVVVSVGLFEVDVPFDGLASARVIEPPPGDKRGKTRPAAPARDAGESAPEPPAGKEQTSDGGDSAAAPPPS